MIRLSRFIPTLLAPLALIAAVALTGCRMTSHVTSPGPAESAVTGNNDSRDTDELSSGSGNDDNAVLHQPSSGTPISGPTIITKPGVYRLMNDIAADAKTGDGIVISSSDVVLWLGDHTLTGAGNKTGRGIVIENAEHVVVQGGRLQTFGIGVVLLEADRCVIRHLRIEGGDEFADPANGIAPQIGMMLINSATNRIARNDISGINLGVFVRGGGSYGNVIRRNEVSAMTHGLLGICYNPAPTGGDLGPSYDQVSENSLMRFGAGIQASKGSASNRFVRNSIGYFNEAWRDFNGSNQFLRNKTSLLAS